MKVISEDSYPPSEMSTAEHLVLVDRYYNNYHKTDNPRRTEWLQLALLHSQLALVAQGNQ